MKRKKLAKIFLITLFVLITWGFIWSCFITKTVKDNNKDKAMKNQHVVVKNIIVTETHLEKKYWEFYAKSGEYDSENTDVQLNHIIGNFYDKDEDVAVSFKSDKGTYSETDKKVILNGNNLFVSKNGAQLYADKLVWQGHDKDILAEGNVQYIQDDKIITKSEKAVFDSQLTNFKVIGNAKTKIYSDDNTKKKYTRL